MHRLCAIELSSVALLALLTIPGCSVDRGRTGEPALRADPFADWVGMWKGSGWAMAADGQRFEFELVERVERRVGGTVLLIAGTGTRAAAAGERVVVHDGVALVSCDDRAQEYRWRGFEVGRRPIDTPLRLIDGGVEWANTDESHNAAVRFTIRVENGRWHEVGEASIDNQRWSTFMECSLTRTSDVSTGALP